jgi:GDPmannose 4,6-dehydratase
MDEESTSLSATAQRDSGIFSNWKDRRVALITGVSGQDGGYLTELLLEKGIYKLYQTLLGYEVHGIVRKNSERNKTINPKVTLHFGDLSDTRGFVDIISAVLPTEIYNLGAQSHVKVC